MIAERIGVGMGCHQRRIRYLGDIPETLLVHVRQVDHDFQFVAGLYQPLAGLRQAGADIRRRGETEGHAVSEDVRAAPDRSKRAKARFVENVKRIQISADRFRALDMEDGGESAFRHGIADIGGRAADLERAC
ncbi:hypothetical protein D3C71_1120830 [compost metagenome]